MLSASGTGDKQPQRLQRTEKHENRLWSALAAPEEDGNTRSWESTRTGESTISKVLFFRLKSTSSSSEGRFGQAWNRRLEPCLWETRGAVGLKGCLTHPHKCEFTLHVRGHRGGTGGHVFLCSKSVSTPVPRFVFVTVFHRRSHATWEKAPQAWPGSCHVRLI